MSFATNRTLQAAFRDYVLTRVHGGLEQPPPEPEPPSDSLGAELQPLAAARPHGAAAAEAASVAADALDAGGLARRWARECTAGPMRLHTAASFLSVHIVRRRVPSSPVVPSGGFKRASTNILRPSLVLPDRFAHSVP